MKLLFILPTKKNATTSREMPAFASPHNSRVCFAVGRFSFQDAKFYMKEPRKMRQRGECLAVPFKVITDMKKIGRYDNNMSNSPRKRNE